LAPTLQGGWDIGAAEISAFEKEGASQGDGDCIGKAVAHVELGGVAGAFAETGMCFQGKASVLVRDRLDGDAGCLQEGVDDGVSLAPVPLLADDRHGRLVDGEWRGLALRRTRKSPHHYLRLRLVRDDRDQSRGVYEDAEFLFVVQ